MAPGDSPDDAQLTSGGSGRPGRVTVCCRVRPLLPNEVGSGVARASWQLTDQSISLPERPVDRGRGGDHSSTSKRELRDLGHLQRDDGETLMDAIFNESATTQDVYDGAYRGIVGGVSEGLNGAIMAYGAYYY